MSLVEVFTLLDDPDMHIPGGLLVTRTSKGTAQDELGRFTTTVNSTTRFNPIMVHDIDGRELQQLPEADRNFETVQAYARQRFFCDDSFQDFVAYNGRDWKVVKVADYLIQGGGFWALIQMREKIQP